MAGIVEEVLKKYGVLGAVAIIVLMMVVWYIAHTNAQPGHKVELFFGMISYVKDAEHAPKLVTPKSDTTKLNTTKSVVQNKQGKPNKEVTNVQKTTNPCDLPWQQRPLDCKVKN
jgi:hypothetical protein